MIELDADDRLAISRLQSSRETSFVQLAVREAALLIPCAVIVWFAAFWGDKAAILVGPGLYAAYKIYAAVLDLLRDRRLGEVILALEEELGRAEAHPEAALVAALSDGMANGDARGDLTAHGAAGCFSRAADESRAAAKHFRSAAKAFRNGKVPRGSAHAFAALGRLDAAGRESRAAAGAQASSLEVKG
jgi:hypothetical protein